MPSIINISLDPKKILADRKKIKKSMQKDISPTYFIKTLTKIAVTSANLVKDDGSANDAHVLWNDRTTHLSQKSHIRDTFNDGKVKRELWVVRTDFAPDLVDATSYPQDIYISPKWPVATNDYFIDTLQLGNLSMYIMPVSLEYDKSYDIHTAKYKYNLSVHYKVVITNGTTVNICRLPSISSMLNANANTLHSQLFSQNWDPSYKDAITAYVKNYNLYEWLKYEAYVWQNEIDAHIAHMWNYLTDKDINRTLRYIGNKSVDLDNYKKIHNALKATGRWSKEELEVICRDNINIQMVHILDNMRNAIDQYPVTPEAPDGYNATALDGKPLSSEQSSAVCSTEPLLLITAGAGTGKTQVITARAKFLIDVGIKPEDILILSFTRTAASTVETRLPGIKSLTINAFVDSIYSKNYPDQSIDDTMTFINTLKALRKGLANDLKKSEFYKEFAKVMLSVHDNESDAYAKLQTFVTNNFDAVMETCRDIGRTTFDIQMVTACVNIYNMSEPDDVKAKYMFIDEVQDNSIFDFIFAIKYCEKHHIALTIVGDASQTLFEFRGADTKAIGVLERSDIFSKERLSINYRSNNEILSIANIMLGWIDANKTSNIQLISDKCAKPTTQSFTDTVKLSYDCVGQSGDKGFRDLLWDKDTAKSYWLEGDIKTFVDECLAKGEKVAFLAFQRKPLELIQRALNVYYPNKNITNLTPPTPYACNILSNYAANADIQGAPYTNVLTTLRASIERSSGTMRAAMQAKHAGEYSPTANVFETIWARFIGTYAVEVEKWVDDVKAGIIDDDQFVINIRDALLDTETQYNSELNKTKLSNNASQERADAKANADLLLSTIHSAKGDEFDNVVVLYHDETNMSEENKRLYYVAFTRAQKRLFISAYGADKNSLIEAQYQEAARNL